MENEEQKFERVGRGDADRRPSEYSIWIYPWDLLDEGPETVVGELAGSGFGTLSVAATYHAARLLLPHNPRRTVYLLEDGVAYFEPHLKCYSGTTLRPLQASLTADGDALQQTIKAGHARRLRVHAWTVFFHNSRLGEQNPDVTIQNAYGERYTYALCPSHPEARAYALALATDLADHYELDALELEAIGYMGYTHLSHHDKAGLCLDLLHDFLLSVCFCRHCKARIRTLGADPEAIRREFRKELEGYFRADGERSAVNEPAAIDAQLAEMIGRTELNSLLVARNEVVCSLVKEVRQSVRKNVQLIMRAASSCFVTGGDAGIEWQSLAAAVDRFLFIQFCRGTDLLETELRRVMEYRDRCGVPLHIGLRAYFPDVTNEKELSERLELLDRYQIRGVQFYNFGLLPQANLEWIRRSIRGR